MNFLAYFLEFEVGYSLFRCFGRDARTRGGLSEATEPTIRHDFRSKIFDFEILDFSSSFWNFDH